MPLMKAMPQEGDTGDHIQRSSLSRLRRDFVTLQRKLPKLPKQEDHAALWASVFLGICCRFLEIIQLPEEGKQTAAAATLPKCFFPNEMASLIPAKGHITLRLFSARMIMIDYVIYMKKYIRPV